MKLLNNAVICRNQIKAWRQQKKRIAVGWSVTDKGLKIQTTRQLLDNRL